MLTAHIQRSCVPFPPEVFSQLRLHDGDEASVCWNGSAVVVSAGAGVKVRNDRVPLTQEILGLSGLKDGDIVSLSTDNGKVVVQQVEDPSNLSDEGHDEHGCPIPPGWLRQRAIGHVDAKSFLSSGPAFARSLRDITLQHGTDIAHTERVLDFGCSCGLLIRALAQVTNARLYGCDSDKEAVNWCKSHLAGEFHHNGEFPPLPWEDGHFDLIYAVSVLTHMDESHQNAWLEEWRRVLKPGGLLLASFKNLRTEIPKLSDAERQACADAMEQTGGMYSAKTGYHDGLFAEYYQMALHTPEYVRSAWGRYFRIMDIIDRGSLLSQEVALMKKTV